MKPSSVDDSFEVYKLELDLAGEPMSSEDRAEYQRQCAYWSCRARQIHRQQQQRELAAILDEAQ